MPTALEQLRRGVGGVKPTSALDLLRQGIIEPIDLTGDIFGTQTTTPAFAPQKEGPGIIRRIGEAFAPRLVTAIEETKEKGIFESAKKFFDPREILKFREQQLAKREEELIVEGKTPEEAKKFAKVEEIGFMTMGAVDAGAGKIAKELKGIAKELEPLAQEARKYKSAEDYLASKTLTTNGINHLDPKEYGNFTSFVRDIEKLNDGSRPVDEIKLAEKLWGNKPKQVVENINPKSIVLAEEPLKVLPKAGRQVTEPITVEVIDGVPTLVDGRHRLAQAIANGQDTIPVKMSGGSKIQKLTDTYYQDLLKSKNFPKELQPLAEHAQKSKTFDDFLTKFKEEAGSFCIEL